MPSDAPKPEDVNAQLERLHGCTHFRGVKLRRLLGFVVGEWLGGRAAKLNLAYIAESLGIEQLTFEDDSDKWGYPRTRANLAHVRGRLTRYYELEGYRDPVIIKLNLGSYAPVIESNPVSTEIPDVEPEIARLILRAKTAIDLRTMRGARRAAGYYAQLPLSLDNPRQLANSIFIPMATASILPGTVLAIKPLLDLAMYALMKGAGGPVDLPGAFFWSQRSAAQGNKMGMLGLIVEYQGGLGTPKDPVKAQYWIQKASKFQDVAQTVAEATANDAKNGQAQSRPMLPEVKAELERELRGFVTQELQREERLTPDQRREEMRRTKAFVDLFDDFRCTARDRNDPTQQNYCAEMDRKWQEREDERDKQ